MGGQCEKSSSARSEINREIRYEITCDATLPVGCEHTSDLSASHPARDTYTAPRPNVPSGTAWRTAAFAHSQVPGRPLPACPALRPRQTAYPRPLRDSDEAFRRKNSVGSATMDLSGLNHAAYRLPVYASQSGSLLDHATCMVRPAHATEERNEGREDQLQPCIRPHDGRRRSRAPMDLRTSRPHHSSGLEDPCCVQAFGMSV